MRSLPGGVAVLRCAGAGSSQSISFVRRLLEISHQIKDTHHSRDCVRVTAGACMYTCRHNRIALPL